MVGVEARVQSMMKYITDRWDQFKQEFNLNDFDGLGLYSIVKLESSGHTSKDILEELRSLAEGHWYDFYLKILSLDAAGHFKFGRSVLSLFDFIKSFVGYMENIKEQILISNFKAVWEDQSVFQYVMSSPIGLGLNTEMASKWLKRFNLEPTSFTDISGYYNDENMNSKFILFTGKNQVDIYIEAKHKIDWNSIQKYERKLRVSFKEILEDLLNTTESIIASLPWEKVAMSYE